MPDNKSWVWYQRDASRDYGEQAQKAYATIIGDFIPALQKAGQPHEFIYCQASDTTNITFETKHLDEIWKIIFADAGFTIKQIPLKDAMEQAMLKEALLRGSNFNKHWH